MKPFSTTFLTFFSALLLITGVTKTLVAASDNSTIGSNHHQLNYTEGYKEENATESSPTCTFRKGHTNEGGIYYSSILLQKQPKRSSPLGDDDDDTRTQIIQNVSSFNILHSTSSEANHTNNTNTTSLNNTTDKTKLTCEDIDVVGREADSTSDILVIGAGIAGAEAVRRLQEVDSNLRIDWVEASNRIGGRIESIHGFGNNGVDDTGYTFENHANWIYSGPYKDFADTLGFQYEDNFDDYSHAFYVFEGTNEGENGDATKLSPDLVLDSIEKYRNQNLKCLLTASDLLWNEKRGKIDQGIVTELMDCGYDPNDPIQYQTHYYKFIADDFVNTDTSLYAVFDPYVAPNSFIIDQRGNQFVIEEYAKQKLTTEPKLGHVVKKIQYNFNPSIADGIKARVLVDTEDGCLVYDTKRIVMTVPVGVLSLNMIEFEPPLAYPVNDYSPFDLVLLTKVWFQFDEAFWDNEEIIVSRSVDGPQSAIGCDMLWNLNYGNGTHTDRNFMPGSNVLLCTIPTPMMETIFGPPHPDVLWRDAVFTEDILDELLSPLKRAYTKYIDPCSILINDEAYMDPFSGYASYGGWAIGRTPYDYAKFFGGYPDYSSSCVHNGCNDNGEWILQIGGSASCLCKFESVEGGLQSGARGANFMLKQLGYNLGSFDNVCYNC